MRRTGNTSVEPTTGNVTAATLKGLRAAPASAATEAQPAARAPPRAAPLVFRIERRSRVFVSTWLSVENAHGQLPPSARHVRRRSRHQAMLPQVLRPSESSVRSPSPAWLPPATGVDVSVNDALATVTLKS